MTPRLRFAKSLFSPPRYAGASRACSRNVTVSYTFWLCKRG
jgi:hypothetical protein